MCMPDRQWLSRMGVERSRNFVVVTSGTLAFPAPPPLPLWVVPDWVTPQLQERTSISPLCLSSTESPLIESTFKNMSTAMCAAPSRVATQFPASDTGIPEYRLPSRPDGGRAGASGGLLRRQLGDEAQGDGQTFELVVRPGEELGGVIARVALHLIPDDLRVRQGFARPG